MSSTNPPSRPRHVVAVWVLMTLVTAACSPQGQPAATATPTDGLSASSTPTSPTTSSTLATPPTTTESVPPSAAPIPTFAPATSELGTCQVMGASTTGWEILLELTGSIGSGNYVVAYALRDADGEILETARREIQLGEGETLSYWDSLNSKTKGVASCDIRRLELDQEGCTAGRGCTVSA